MAAVNVFDVPVKTILGEEKPFGDFAKGKVTLVVNTASACGLTPQYAGLEELQQRYRAQGFSVIGFPCNQFGGQAPGDSATEENFACTKYKTTFPMMAKIDVNGPKEAPLWKVLKDQKSSMLGRDIKWNFAKFLIAKDGKVVERYLPTTSPGSIASDIETELAK